MLNRNVIVVTHGRFHSFDLAERLQAAGRLAAIYTGYPKFRLRNTRVDPRRIHSFPWFETPHMALGRFAWLPQSMWRNWLWHGGEALNKYAARTLPECGLVTALSGSGSRAGAEIKRRGGVYVCDRGSTHIQWVDRELRREYESLGLRWGGIDPRPIANEIKEYELADAITVPSRFTARTFVEMGVSASKVHCIPYGVDLSVFRRSAERAANFRVLFVGALSVRKGVHYLLDAFARANLPGSELILAGGSMPETESLVKRAPNKGVTRLGIISRKEVAREMSCASVLVLPSIEEGLALVQGQALACGCPVIATINTGAEDLFTDGREGFIVPARDAGALADKLTQLYNDRARLEDMSRAAVARVKSFGGWDQYGRASIALFDALMDAKSRRG